MLRHSEQGTVLAFPSRLPVRQAQISDSGPAALPVDPLMPAMDTANQPAAVFREIAWALIIPVGMMSALQVVFIYLAAL